MPAGRILNASWEDTKCQRAGIRSLKEATFELMDVSYIPRTDASVVTATKDEPNEKEKSAGEETSTSWKEERRPAVMLCIQ